MNSFRGGRRPMRPGGGPGGGQGGGPRPPMKRGGKPPFGKKKSFKPFKKKPKRRPPAPPPVNTMEYTGLEALYLKTLMEQETPVVLKLTSGELVRGYVRYYDKDTFSFSPGDGSPKMFVRKTGIRYLYEEPAEETAKYAKLAPEAKEGVDYVEEILIDDDEELEDDEFEDDDDYEDEDDDDEEYEDDDEFEDDDDFEDDEEFEDEEEEEVVVEKPAPKAPVKPAARAPRASKK